MAADYRNAAASCALRDILGSDLIAFRQLAARNATLGFDGRALDLGCGA